MKLLFVLNSYPACGGIETVTSNLAEYLCKDFTIYTLAVYHDSNAPISTGIGQSYHFPGLEYQPNVDYYNSLVADLGIDCVINQGMSPYLTEIIFNPDRKQSVKIISVLHGMPEYEKKQFWLQKSMADAPRYKRIERRCLAYLGLNARYRRYIKEFRNACRKCTQMGDKTVLLTEGFIDQYVKAYSLKQYRDRISAIPNPLSRFYSVLGLPDWSQKKNAVLFVGRLSEEKRVNLLLEVWKMIPHKGWELVIVGDGPLRHDLETQAKKTDNVRFIGYKRDLSEYYKRGKIVALTSAFEGFGMCLVEGMSYGAYPIAFDIGYGVASVLNAGGGQSVPDGDIKSMAESMSRLLENDQLLKKLSEQAYKKSRKYCLEIVGEQWVGLLNGLMHK